MPCVVVKVDDYRPLLLLKICALHSNLEVLRDLTISLQAIGVTLIHENIVFVLPLHVTITAVIRFPHSQFVDAIALVWFVLLRQNDLIKADCLIIILTDEIAVLLREIFLLDFDGEEARMVHDSMVIDANELVQELLSWLIAKEYLLGLLVNNEDALVHGV